MNTGIFNMIASATKPKNLDFLQYKKFKKIDSDLKKKHKKVRKEIEIKISWINKNFHEVYESLTDEQIKSIRKHIESFNLNNLHDAQENLENLISENYRNFVSWSAFLQPRKSSKVWINKKGLECFKMDF